MHALYRRMRECQEGFVDMAGAWKPIAVTLLCGATVGVSVLRYMKKHKVTKAIQRAREKREKELQEAERAVTKFKAQNPGVDLSSIVALPLSELRQRIQSGSLRPDAVLHAYIEKALEVNRKLNCNTAFITESLQQLEDIESYKDGLLYGIPISIKENIDYKGYNSTCGVVTKLDAPADMDSVVVRALKKQGAIPFIKTNVPQGLLNYECSNPIYGRTCNPCNLQKTCGGSSGGEGALVGGGGSILGVGTDIGGSVRIPAAFCGMCGLKPTSNRLSMEGFRSCVKGVKSVFSSLGPIARDVESLAVFMRALLSEDMFALDPKVPPIPFNQQVYESTGRLRIGYCENDGYMKASPSMIRALRETKERLEKAGHTLIPFKPPRVVTAMSEFFVRGNLADGGITLMSHFKGGPVDPCVQYQTLLCNTPHFVKKFISLLLTPIYPRMALLIRGTCGVGSPAELWKQQKDVEDYVTEMVSEWRKLDLDVLLYPMLGPAFNFTYPARLTSALSYTGLFNVLNFPAGTVPVTKVTADDEDQLRGYRGNFGDPWDKLFVKAVRDGEDLPLGVQCVALPWKDEMCLRFMREVEELCAKDKC